MATTPTIPEIIRIAKISQYLADTDVANGSLFGKRLDERLPVMLYIERVIIEKIYNLDNNYDGIEVAADYLYALCGKYSFLARQIEGTGIIVPPSQFRPFVYLIPILGSQFTDTTNYDDTRIIGKELQIFWNDVDRFLHSDEYETTATGVNILVAGFDAVANPTYELKIYIVNV